MTVPSADRDGNAKTRRSRGPLTSAALNARSTLLALAASCTCLLAAAPSAHATANAPAWSITSVPTRFVPGDGSGAAFYLVTATNTGGAATDGSTVTLSDSLPSGLSLAPGLGGGDDVQGTFSLSCAAGPPITCADPAVIQPGEAIQMVVPVDIAGDAPTTVTNSVSVSGGGAPAASASAADPVNVTPASFGFLPGSEGFDGSVTNADGSTDTQAGSHPYAVTTGFELNSFPNLQDFGNLTPFGDAKNVTVNLPAGVIVNPAATPTRCTEAQLETDSTGGGCPDSSQVGVVRVNLALFTNMTVAPLYNMVPPAGAPAELGFDVFHLGIYEHLIGGVRTGGDYGLTANISDLLQKVSILGTTVTLWGDPSDASHDAQRGLCTTGSRPRSGLCPTERENTAFLTLPSACSGPLTTTISADSWQNSATVVSDSFRSHDADGKPVGVTGCDRLDFSPSITVQPDTTAADSPTGLSVDLRVPPAGLSDFNGLAEADLKKAIVTLPAGVSVNPSAANGLAACTPTEIGIDNPNEPSCPDASKIGSVEVDTPLLPDPLKGGVYVAQQNNNPFGSLLAIYVTAEADGALIKLAGHVVANPVTGQLTTTFDNNPQLPFSDFKLDFYGGARAVLATPESCGSFDTQSFLSPWSGTPTVGSSDPFTISSGCVSGFSPSLTAGTQNAQAGAYAPFVLSLSRSDADQNFSGLSVKLPPGMLAKLAGVQECTVAQLAQAATNSGKAQLANPSCPAGSQVGTVTTGAGVGPDPFFLSGKAYLTGPYKGAPYGLAVVVPAVAGPFDLGTVVVRQALYIDPTTAQVTDVSDPFPTILDGIPLDIRRIDVDLNRPDFTVNPTSCDPMSVTGTATSTQGASASLSSHFQVGGCQDIGFAPKLKIALTGKGKTRSGDHPTLTATLTDPAGQANIHSAKVALPLSIALDPNNSQHVCAFATAAAVHGGPVGCPTSTIVGTATAVTPLLSQPLTGSVYLVQGLRCQSGQVSQQGTCPNGATAIHTLPSLLVPLRGQIALDLRAQSSVSGGKLVTTFPTIPDAPVSQFALRINGGKKGLLVVTGRGLNICAKKQIGNADFGAQSGKTHAGNMTLSTPCGSPAKLKVVSKKMTADALTLKVQTSERGKVTVTGQQIASFGKMLAPGTHEIKVQVKHGSSRGSRAKHATSTKVTVKLAPANAMPATKTLSVRT